MNQLIFSISALLLFYTTLYAVSLDSTVARSDSCVAIEWTPDSSNTSNQWYIQYGALCTNKDSIYRRCDFIPGRTYQGIAYSYGGEDPWYIFRNHLATGYLAGSHQCHYSTYGDPSKKVTGTDCSGFLCFVWGIPRTNTTDLYNNKSFTTIPIANVTSGDALIKASAAYGYHAILVVEAEDPTEVVISEASSTVFGCRQRIVNLTTSEWSPYKAIRNPALQRPQSVKSIVNSFQELKITQSGNNITVCVNQPVPGLICGYDINGSILFRKKLENARTEYSFTSTLTGSRVILLSLHLKGISKTFKLSLL